MSTPALCAPRVDIPSAYVVAAEDNGIPPEVLYAVASAESKTRLDAGVRPWPWTLNVAGKSMRFGDRQSACQALRDALEATQIIDVGIAQLNVRWQPQLFGQGRRFADPCEGLNPYANLDEAARLLRQYHDDSGDWVVAAGRYHRPAGGKPAARYRAIVSRELAALGATPSLQTPSVAVLVARAQPSSSARESGGFTPPSKVVAARRSSDPDDLTWVTPEPLATDDSAVTWVTPTQRQWMAEVASR
ncbi:hypothetical protein [uncultured Salinicola sp.]|uniref:hypothetical protein n=1 Tax=uncultured Salinicola sp. TaxID=1193542 RepID=UPI002639D558|nr:hypothetical protein [uncultured Salinicola sp.]